uniref:Xylanolytic transcriptional activator regulatory domain-containing protein n=1 Tax=Kwoniella bestiolae CBS 10118 TaxID=1296100 RepID=A0A1B9GFT3_9TREE|nr:hypothetical protein I302_01381 [Kwoniella bestiolae CBS 10118]OCF29868.1 hypothetical protein I302_01381 [Kwoniella bestiolae CBS 10118]
MGKARETDSGDPEVPKRRKLNSHACDACNAAKAKCEGGQIGQKRNRGKLSSHISSTHRMLASSSDVSRSPVFERVNTGQPDKEGGHNVTHAPSSEGNPASIPAMPVDQLMGIVDSTIGGSSNAPLMPDQNEAGAIAHTDQVMDPSATSAVNLQDPLFTSGWPSEPVHAAVDIISSVTSQQSQGSAPSQHAIRTLQHDMPDERLSAASWKQDDPSRSSCSGFLDSVYRSLSTTLSLRSFPRTINDMPESDDEDTGQETPSFLPPESDAQLWVDCYFDHSSVSYRFLSRAIIQQSFVALYADKPLHPEDTILLLIVLAVGCLWSASWKNLDPMEKRSQAKRIYNMATRTRNNLQQKSTTSLRTVQIELVTVQLQLGLSHFRAAWIHLGTAARIGQMLGLHRHHIDNPVSVEQSRQLAFWVTFILDRYLSAVLGLPTILREEDINQAYFCEHSPLSDGTVIDPTDAKALPGSLVHIKLGHILGHCLQYVMRTSSSSHEVRHQGTLQLEQELDEWQRSIPSFFKPRTVRIKDSTSQFYMVDHLFERQRRTVEGAYWFIRLLLYRNFLLEEFLSASPGALDALPHRQVPNEVRKCVEAAMAIAEMAAEIKDDTQYNGTYWTSAYFTFCAIAVLLVYMMLYDDALDDKEIRKILESAQLGLARMTWTTQTEWQSLLQESQKFVDIAEARHRRWGGIDWDQIFLSQSRAPSPGAGGTSSTNMLSGGINVNDLQFWQDVQLMCAIGLPSGSAELNSLVRLPE